MKILMFLSESYTRKFDFFLKKKLHVK